MLFAKFNINLVTILFPKQNQAFGGVNDNIMTIAHNAANRL